MRSHVISLCSRVHFYLRNISKILHLLDRRTTATLVHAYVTSREHVTPVLKELHWLPARRRISFKVLVLTYQALHGTARQYMTDLLSRYQPTRSLRSMGRIAAHRLRSFGDRAFQHASPRPWNGLPISIRSANNLNRFFFKNML